MKLLLSIIFVSGLLIGLSSACNIGCYSCFDYTCTYCYNGYYYDTYYQDCYSYCSGNYIDYSDYSYGGNGVCYHNYYYSSANGAIIAAIVIPIAFVVICMIVCIISSRARRRRLARGRIASSRFNQTAVVQTPGIPVIQEVSVGYQNNMYQPAYQQTGFPQMGYQQGGYVQNAYPIQGGYPQPIYQ